MKEKEKTLREATLIFLVRDGKVLLPLKTKKIGKGCRNGYGGGLEQDEDMFACAVRELCEEASIQAKKEDLEKVAELNYHNITEDGLEWDITVHTFLLSDWVGEIGTPEAMVDPKWYTFSELPIGELMVGTDKWLSKVLAGKKVKVEGWHGPHQKTLLRPDEITEVLSFEN